MSRCPDALGCPEWGPLAADIHVYTWYIHGIYIDLDVCIYMHVFVYKDIHINVCMNVFVFTKICK
jgi:hypothetical protein